MSSLPLLLQQYAPLLAVFSSQGQSELILLQKVQEYCYDNIHFMKAFQKIVVLFYKGIRPRGSTAVCPVLLQFFALWSRGSGRGQHGDYTNLGKF